MTVFTEVFKKNTILISGVTLTRYGHRGSKGPQAYTFFRTRYETNFIWKYSISRIHPLFFV